MNILALFGWLVNVIPRVYTYYISTALMAIFGIKMLKEGCQMSRTEGQEELEEVQMELRQRDEEVGDNIIYTILDKHISPLVLSNYKTKELLFSISTLKHIFGPTNGCASFKIDCPTIF